MKRDRKLFRQAFPVMIAMAVHIAYLPESCAQEQSTEEIKNFKTDERKKFSFKTNFLKTFNTDIDISYFENDELLLPGTYPVELIINKKKLGIYKIDFVTVNNVVTPCIAVIHIEKINIDSKKMPADWRKTSCIDVASTLSGATVSYDYDNERVLVNIPQIYLANVPEGYIDPARWDEGISALSVNYFLTGTDTTYRNTGHTNSSYYGNLFTTLRKGAWRFTTYDSYSGGSQLNNRLDHMQAFAQRPIKTILSEFSFGDLNTSGQIFNSTLLRGAILQSDDRMHPWSLKGYAPVVRGIANSDAVVTVKQNGSTIYEKNVPPGEFSFNDIVALGYGGDLDVTITESGGSQRNFSVPYNSVPQLLREGYYRYALAAGQIRRYGLSDVPYLFESSLQYGLSNLVTLYGGLQVTAEQNYSALNSGVAVNTPLGAFSVDVTKSFFSDPAADNRKNSFMQSALLKFGLSKNINQTDTNFNVMSYHFAGDNYFTLDDALSVYDRRNHGNTNWLPERYRRRLEISVSQLLKPGWGELMMSGWVEKINNNHAYSDSRSSYSFGYRNSLNATNYSLNVSKTFLDNLSSETTYYFNLTTPFGSTVKKRPTLRTSLSYSSDDARIRAGISGNHQGKDYNSWLNTWFSQSSKTQSNFGINAGHTGTALQKSIGYSQGMNHYSASATLGGGMLIHENGIIFSSSISDTMALIEAPGATGASILGDGKSKINEKGYALVNYISPYEENVLTLDIKGAPLGFDPVENSQTVIPTAGAVVKVSMKSNNQLKSVIRRLKLAEGIYPPFGARLFDENNNLSATVGQGGIVIFPMPDKYKIFVAKWRSGAQEHACVIQPWVNPGGELIRKDGILECKRKDAEERY